MPKYTIITCDLCGSSDMGQYLIIKAKKRWFGWMETGMASKKIYICEDCQNSLKCAATEDRIKRSKNRE